MKRIQMLFKLKDVTGYKLHCLDGDIGKAKEFYFDDRHWAIRYLVADTGNWLAGRHVLISPQALMKVDEAELEISINLTKKQVEDSPGLDSDKPVSKQFEEEYYDYYSWPGYWTGTYMWGAFPYMIRSHRPAEDGPKPERTWNPDLLSTAAVLGYHIQGSDGQVGHVEDFIIDEETWAIRYFVIDTRNWWPGEAVLISPGWITDVSWSESLITVNLTREAIKASPRYTREMLIGRQFENTLHEHYDRKGYWKDLPNPPASML